MTSGLFELAIVVLIAAALGIAAKLLRQPIVLAYLITGLLIGYFGFLNLGNREFFAVFSDLGIMFLLFLVGLEINYTSLRLVGRASIIVGLGQIVFTFLVGLLIAHLLNFSLLTAVYISIALTFSSTIIVVKLLSEKKDLHSLYGKLSIGFLLVQDLVAILILILLAGVGREAGFQPLPIAFAVAKGIVLFLATLWLGRRALPLLFDKIARSQELLFLTSLAWVFLVVSAVSRAGFSLEIGGFLAGLALANSSENFEIAYRIRPLRDFFILIFFVILGASLVLSHFLSLALPVLIFSLFVLVGNPLIVLLIMGLMGYRKRTSFMAGLTVAQISEFSLILAALGYKLGHISEEVVALITAVGIITITTSAYLIIHAQKIFQALSPYLSLFERRSTKKEDGMHEAIFQKPIILIGCHRTGQSIAFNLPKKDLLVVEFDPEVVNDLKRHGIDYVFGDITDPEVFEKANFRAAKLIISTNPDLEDNLALLRELKRAKGRHKIIVRAEDEKDVALLYNEGADYVLLPHFTAGQYLGKTIAIDPEMKILGQLKSRDLTTMKQLKYVV